MKTRNTLPLHSLPKDYGGLCRRLMPRPIHDRAEDGNIINSMALWQDDFTPDQKDYLDLLRGSVEDFDPNDIRSAYA